jgi:hypothetical protein
VDWTDRVDAMKIEIHPPATIESCATVLESRGFRCWRDERHWACLCAVKDDRIWQPGRRSSPNR